VADNFIFTALPWNSGGLLSREQIELAEFLDARNLSLLPMTDNLLHSPLDSRPTFPLSFDAQLSAFRNPFHALVVILHRLSNCESTDDISSLMDELAQLPGFNSIFKMLIQIDVPAIRAAMPGFLNCIAKLDDPDLFQSLAQAIIKRCSTWLRSCSTWFRSSSYQIQKTKNTLLILAVRYDLGVIYKDLLEHGAELNKTTYTHLGSFNEAFPLGQAVEMGNINMANRLLDDGAKLDFRASGLTATGHLLRALARDNQHRDGRLKMLHLFLERGSDIMAPFREERFSLDDGTSAETLLDYALLQGDEDVSSIFTRLHDIPAKLESQWSMWGIIEHAKASKEDLQRYLNNTPSPRHIATARRLQRAALAWAANKAIMEAVLAMIQVGFDVRPLLSDGHNAMLPEVDMVRKSKDGFLKRIFQDGPLEPLSKRIALTLLKSYRGTEVEYTLIEACLGSNETNMVEFLFREVLNMSKANTRVTILARAARSGHGVAVSLMRRLYPGAFTETIRFWNSRCSALLLSAATSDENSPSSSMLRGTGPASSEMLSLLLNEGADNISTCYPCFWTHQHWITGEQLKWLIKNLAGKELKNGPSLYAIMFPSIRQTVDRNEHRSRRGRYRNRYTRGRYGNRYTRVLNQEQIAIESSILESLHTLGIPICSPHESMLLCDYRNFETDNHPLSFFISRRPSHDLMRRILEAKIDVNGTGKILDTDTPLMSAIAVNNLNLVDALVSCGARLEQTENQHAFTGLQLACGVQSVKYGWEDDDPSEIGLHAGYHQIVEYLLQRKADPNARGNYCCISPLQLAESALVAQLLLDYRADPKETVTRCRACIKLHSPNWPLFGDSSYVLGDSPLDDGYSISMLHFAVSRSLFCGTEDSRLIVEKLLYKGADINERPSALGFSLLEMATGAVSQSRTDVRETHHDIELVRLLLQHKAQVNPPLGYSGRSALAGACQLQNLGMIKLLLEHGAKPNPENEDAEPPLSIAAATGNLAAVIFLLLAGALVQIRTRGDSPLVAAARYGRLDLVVLLMGLENRHEVYIEAKRAANRENHTEVVSCLQKCMEQRSGGHLRTDGQETEDIVSESYSIEGS